MQEITDFNLEKETTEVLNLKNKLQENIKELSKYGISLEDILKEMEAKSNE